MDGEIWGLVSELWVGRGGGELQGSASCLTVYPCSPEAQTPCASQILCHQSQLPPAQHCLPVGSTPALRAEAGDGRARVAPSPLLPDSR